MDMYIKKAIKLFPISFFAVSIIAFVTALIVKDIPENKTYVYENKKIITHSWHDYFEIATSAVLVFIILSLLLLTIILIIQKIKAKEKVLRKLQMLWMSGIICYVITMISNIMVINIENNDYNPEYYKFSNGNHTIVIEEKSFLLYGGGTIYQIMENNSAVIIGKISTDDGGRNNGDYDIKWYNDHAEITYNTFNTKESTTTETVKFE